MFVPVTVTAVASTNAPEAVNDFVSIDVASGRVTLSEPEKAGALIRIATFWPAVAAMPSTMFWPGAVVVSTCWTPFSASVPVTSAGTSITFTEAVPVPNVFGSSRTV